MTSFDYPLFAFRSSLEFFTLLPLSVDLVKNDHLFRQLPSLRFFPLRRFPDNGQPLFPSLPILSFGAFSVFLTLSRLSSIHYLPAFFHADPVLGVFTLQGRFSLTDRITFSSLLLPSCG